jgi:hypothetical protein
MCGEYTALEWSQAMIAHERALAQSATNDTDNAAVSELEQCEKLLRGWPNPKPQRAELVK